MATVKLTASDLGGELLERDIRAIEEMEKRYQEVLELSKEGDPTQPSSKNRDKIIEIYNEIGARLQEIVAEEEHLHVYSFDTPRPMHGEVSRLIHKLRDPKTNQPEFVYYIQRAFEMLFNLAFAHPAVSNKNYLITPTPVTVPVQNYSVHKIPHIDDLVENSVMCVMLRGALLPSMIMSKEMEEYSSMGFVTPFALFRIKRNDHKTLTDMEYLLDLDSSYFDLESLNDKHLIFADPMNATGGSMVTIVKYLLDQGVKPRSIKCLNVISALKGSLQIVRAVPDIELYTLWLDPVLNQLAYILPGLGDAGDRLNGCDSPDYPRNMIQLIADYGAGIVDLYRNQVREIEKTVLG